MDGELMPNDDLEPSLAEGSEPDVIEQRQLVLAEQDIERLSDASEASEADVIDQARIVSPTGHFQEPTIRPDVPEADALDQARAVLPGDYDEI